MKKTSKRFFVSAMMTMATVCSFAQGLTATLQQSGKMVPYYGADAFKEAYAAASNGAVITLSAGTFNTVDSITKQITIIGNGAIGDNQTYISGRSTKTKDNWNIYMVIKANNVRIEGIRFNSSYPVLIREVNNLKISHCYITTLRATHKHTNTIIDQCYIDNDYSMSNSYNYCLKNSFIGYFNTKNSENNIAYITNCLIYKYSYCHNDGTNVYFSYDSYPIAIYKNCILGQYDYSQGYSGDNKPYWRTVNSNRNCEYYNNVFFYYPYSYNGTSFILVASLKTLELLGVPTGIGNMKSTFAQLFGSGSYYEPGYIKTDLKGDDGKQVGPYGGSGFSMIPSIPRITSSTIDSYTNAEGKINVKIKVENNQ